MPLRAVFFFLLLPLAAPAQNGVLNATIFRHPDLRAQIDVVWQLDPRVLHYRHTTGDSIAAAYQTEAALLRDTTVVYQQTWTVKTPATTPAAAGGLNLLDRWQVAAAPGRYRVQVRITEPGFEKASFVLTQPVKVDSLTVLPALSQAQLLDTFYSEAVGDRPANRKMLQRTVPLAADFLADERRLLHFRVDAYGLDRPSGPPPAQPLSLRTVVTQRGAELPATLQRERIDPAGGATTVLRTVRIGTVPSGNYALLAVLEDDSGRRLAVSERAFQRSNGTPDAVAVTVAADTTSKREESLLLPNLRKTFVADFKPAQLPAVLRMLAPIATPEEGLAIQALLRNPDPELVRPFVYQAFAQRRPDNPDAAWQAHANAVRAVNRDFRRGITAGYETERGRVQLRYGPPDERITVPVESGTRPYEVWLYNGLPGTASSAAFLFYQPGGPLDDYSLLHSTAPGEIRNPQWRRYLYTDSEAGARSRADSYFPAR